MRYDTISFLSDYGLVDEFVGVCKAVIRQLAPDAVVLDLTHDVAPHDVRAGSLALVRAAQYLPDGVVLAVVDPGVGTERRAVAVEVAGGDTVFVGPDNGLLAPAVAMLGGATRAVELTNGDLQLVAPGPTFAGRDVFAPAAAYLCAGTPLEALGRRIDPVTLLPAVVPLPREEQGRVAAEVLWVDRYGNVQLNVDGDELERLGAPRPGDVVSLTFGSSVRTARRARTYGDIRPGEIGIVVDSYGLVSVCLDRRSASAELGMGAGASVTLELPSA